MNLKSNLKKGTHKVCSLYNLSFKSLIVSTFIMAGLQTPLLAQDVPLQEQETEVPAKQYSKPFWWFGVAGGANFNYYRGSTQQLNESFIVPTTFHDGDGIGLYLAPLVEFHRPDSRWGMMLQAGIDGRKGTFNQVITPCNCPADLSADIIYLTFEPSLRFAPFKSNFYLYAGPRLAYNLESSFTYSQGINPAYPEQIAAEEVKGDLSDVNQMLLSMQVGAGYDFPISKAGNQAQFVISPFVSFQPYFGQNPRSTETWNVTTIRAGIALKLGRGHEIPSPVVVVAPLPVEVVVVDPEVEFTVSSPENIAVERKVVESFPIRNYIFFDLGSTEIPERYVLLNKSQVKDFKEDQLESNRPKNLSGRSDRQMIVYYNILNILGDRMQKNPETTIKLVGSSEKGAEDAKEMAESVKEYLVNVFGISASRITTEGRSKPKIPSQQPGQTNDLVLLREGDRRVSIESSSPKLLMEFQNGPNASLKPVEIVIIQEAPVESYAVFDAAGSDEAFTTWSLEITDDAGKIQYFGPYTEEKVSMPGADILGTRAEGTYKVTMIGQTISGKTVRKETTTHLVLWKPATVEEGMRFSIIYEFDESKAIPMYEKYLTEVVVPKIPNGGTVIIHGHTDIIGEEVYNQKLSVDRANDVKRIMENGLSKAGRNDVKFEIFGYGEDPNLTLFDNKYPEERFYNRTVIIDIIPKK
ncbi:MAG: OmpA family protein [Bacteroidales bacterium]|nr:OmpA family protein [Bacteroidales bacterium]